MRELPLPTGTVTFLFTDIEGSTRRWEAQPDSMQDALRRHDALLRGVIESRGGYVFKTVGDAFCAAFALVDRAVTAAIEIQEALAAHDWEGVGGLSVRMAIHVGIAEERDGDYFGQPVNRVARLLNIGHGGQVLLSSVAAELARASLPVRAHLHDMGLHRLKDLALPERVYQLAAPGLSREFPPLRSLDSAHTNLPLQVTSFVGRADELKELARMLEHARIVTLVGAGGVGKTRLALQTGAEISERFTDGVWFVQLAQLADPALIAHEAATTLGAHVSSGRPVADAVVAALRNRRALLVFDNCEHVAAAASELIETIVRACPHVVVLATSREALHIAGEHVLRVGSLALPSEHVSATVEAALGSPAVQLFSERARAATGTFELTDGNVRHVVDICRRLDGIALAIELAAPKLAMLGPQQLSERLHERFRILTGGSRTALPRQQTMRALIDWSYDLLDEREQALFRRLAIFAGGWTLEAAAHVCSDAALDAWDVFELLSSLAAKSLVTVEGEEERRRYGLLQSTRDYARERLEAVGESEPLARTHAEFYLARLRDVRALWEAMDDRAWQCAVCEEVDNVRAALDWSLGRGQAPSVGLGILAELHRPRLVMLPQEALRWFELGLETARGLGDAALIAAIAPLHAALRAMGVTSIAERIALAETARDAASAANDGRAYARAAMILGVCLADAGRLEEADTVFAEGSEALEAESTPSLKADLLADWAANDLKRSDIERARQRFAQSLQIAPSGSFVNANVFLRLGELEFAAGHVEAASASAEKAKLAYAALHSTLNLGVVACNLAAYAMAVDEFVRAREALVEALGILRHAGSVAWLVLALEHHAVLAALTGDHERALRLLGYTVAQYQELGQVRDRTERHGFERAMAVLRARFGDAFEGGISEGGRMRQEDALSHAAAIGRADLHATLPIG